MGSNARIFAAISCAVALAALTFAVASGATLGFDLAINAGFAPYRVPWLLAGFLWLTALGTGASQLGIAVTASALLWSFDRTRALLALWTTFLGAEATTWSVKFLVDRPRPAFLPGIAAASSPSFPSAHATATTAVIGMLAWIVAEERRDRRRAVVLAAGGSIGLIAFSRIFLNVHYPTDVLAGLLVGGIWLAVGSRLAERTPRHRVEAIDVENFVDHDA